MTSSLPGAESIRRPRSQSSAESASGQRQVPDAVVPNAVVPNAVVAKYLERRRTTDRGANRGI